LLPCGYESKRVRVRVRFKLRVRVRDTAPVDNIKEWENA
jgi:hypothetical protein